MNRRRTIHDDVAPRVDAVVPQDLIHVRVAIYPDRRDRAVVVEVSTLQLQMTGFLLMYLPPLPFSANVVDL